MDNDKSQRQVSKWKEKYYQSLSDLEQHKDSDALLRRSLSRLAFVAQGLDPELDSQLNALRNNLRKKVRNKHR